MADLPRRNRALRERRRPDNFCAVNIETAPTAPIDESIEPDVSHLVTEDDTPVDNPFCEKQMRLLTHPLYASWKPGVPFVAMANVGVYFALNRPALVPDTLVAVGVESPADLLPKKHRAYFAWLYGKAPDVVVELVSNREGDELDRKMRGYAVHGVPFYVVYDPEGHIQTPALQCFQLDHSASAPRYLPLEKAFFPAAQLGLVEWDGEFEGKRAPWIRWVDGEGKIIPTAEERAEVAGERVEALAAKLRELGVDPDAVAGR